MDLLVRRRPEEKFDFQNLTTIRNGLRIFEILKRTKKGKGGSTKKGGSWGVRFLSSSQSVIFSTARVPFPHQDLLGGRGRRTGLTNSSPALASGEVLGRAPG